MLNVMTHQENVNQNYKKIYQHIPAGVAKIRLVILSVAENVGHTKVSYTARGF